MREREEGRHQERLAKNRARRESRHGDQQGNGITRNRPNDPFDVVALARDVDDWPAGTTGTVVESNAERLLVEIDDPLGRVLAFLESMPEEVRPAGRL